MCEAKNIYHHLRTNLLIQWTWGFHSPKSLHNGLQFSVRGLAFQGMIRQRSMTLWTTSQRLPIRLAAMGKRGRAFVIDSSIALKIGLRALRNTEAMFKLYWMQTTFRQRTLTL